MYTTYKEYPLILLLLAYCVLFVCAYGLFFIWCRLTALPCPRCKSKYLTEVVGEWGNTEDWHCARCDHYWGVKLGNHE